MTWGRLVITEEFLKEYRGRVDAILKDWANDSTWNTVNCVNLVGFVGGAGHKEFARFIRSLFETDVEPKEVLPFIFKNGFIAYAASYHEDILEAWYEVIVNNGDQSITFSYTSDWKLTSISRFDLAKDFIFDQGDFLNDFSTIS